MWCVGTSMKQNSFDWLTSVQEIGVPASDKTVQIICITNTVTRMFDLKLLCTFWPTECLNQYFYISIDLGSYEFQFTTGRCHSKANDLEKFNDSYSLESLILVSQNRKQLLFCDQHTSSWIINWIALSWFWNVNVNTYILFFFNRTWLETRVYEEREVSSV